METILNLDLHTLADWGTRLIAGASVLLILMQRLAGLIEIWHAKHSGCHFWNIYDKLEASVQYIGLSHASLGGNGKKVK